MATNKEYLNFILEQLSGLQEIAYRQAFGEYMIYYKGKTAAYLCDNRLLVKPMPSAVRMMPDAHYAPPYEEATVLSQADPHWIAAESAVPAFLRGLLIFSHAVGLMRPPKPEREKWLPTLVVTFMIIRLEDSVMFEDNAAKEIGQPQKL